MARTYAEEIAALALSGYLTTEVSTGAFGRYWRVTPTGLAHLWEQRENA